MSNRPPARPIAERLWDKVTRGPIDDCWTFDGYRNSSGYGLIHAAIPGRRWIRAHRVSFALASGIDPYTFSPDIHVRHTCDNPPCVNPRHLLPGTNADNVKDKVQRGRSVSGCSWHTGECVNGHDVTDPANVFLLPDGRRQCRPCRRLTQAAYRERRRKASA